MRYLQIRAACVYFWAVAAVMPLPAIAGSSPALSLKDSAAGLFRLGVAINESHFLGSNSSEVALVDQNFDSVTPENALKWENIHPQLDRYDFSAADRYVEFGVTRNLFTVGHTLMWHNQTPDWVFQDAKGNEISRSELLERLRSHIKTVVGRYRGKIKGWDVVNEAIRDEDGLLRTDRPWYRILGEEGIFEAFKAAHEADPEAELYYNDYSLNNPVKRAAAIKLVQKIRERGLRVDAIGSQEHHLLKAPTIDEIEATFRDFERAGIKAAVTELDVSVLPRPQNYQGAETTLTFKNSSTLNPYEQGLPEMKSAELSQRYADIIAVYVKYRSTITRVTFWGVTDKDSWLNNWPIRGRTDYPLIFDRGANPKPAAIAISTLLRKASAGAP